MKIKLRPFRIVLFIISMHLFSFIVNEIEPNFSVYKLLVSFAFGYLYATYVPIITIETSNKDDKSNN